MNRKQRIQNKDNYEKLIRDISSRFWVCDHCGEKTNHGHFCPPCFGYDGFYLCKKKESTYFVDMLSVLERPSIWKPTSVTDEPSTTLYQWQIYDVDGDFDHAGKTRHFMGYTGREGRVSSPVIEFDSVTMQGRTKSGRVYKLSGRPGFNSVATYVWSWWLDHAKNPGYECVTDNFWKDSNE